MSVKYFYKTVVRIVASLVIITVVFSPFGMKPNFVSSGNFNQWTGINNIAFNPITGGNGVVSSTCGNTEVIDLELDENGFPHLLFRDSSNTSGDLYYVKWDGMSWVSKDNNPFLKNRLEDANITKINSVCNDGDLALDRNGRPHIIWTDIGSDYPRISYIYLNNNVWLTFNDVEYNNEINNATIDGVEGFWLSSPNIDIDKANRVSICWIIQNGIESKIKQTKHVGHRWIDLFNYDYIPGDPNSGTFFSTDNFISSLDYSIDSRNNPVYVWAETYSWNSSRIKIASYIDNNLSEKRISSNSYVDKVSVSTGSNGSVYLIWSGIDESSKNIYIQDMNEKKYSPKNLTNDLGWADDPEIAISENGEIGIVFKFTNESFSEILYMSDKYECLGRQTTTNFLKNLSISQINSYVQNPKIAFSIKQKPIISWSGFINSNIEAFVLTKGEYKNQHVNFNIKAKIVDVNRVINTTDIVPGETIKYTIDWELLNGQVASSDSHIYSEIPVGTSYVQGASSVKLMEHSIDGETWIQGEPPEGSQNRVKIRWNIGDTRWSCKDGSGYDISSYENFNHNVSMNYGESFDPSVLIGDDGRTHLVWADTFAGFSDIYYVYSDDNDSWKGTDGSSYTDIFTSETPNLAVFNLSKSSSFSHNPTVFINQKNELCVLWQESQFGYENLCLAKLDGSNWVNQGNRTVNNTTGNDFFIPTPGNTISDPVIVSDNKGIIHICGLTYDSDMNTSLFYMKLDSGNWVSSSGDRCKNNPYNSVFYSTDDTIYNPSMAIDKSGNPLISWEQQINYESKILCSQLKNGSWMTLNGSMLDKTSPESATLDIPGSNLSDPSIVIDLKNNLHISWVNSDTNNIYYLKSSENNWKYVDDTPFSWDNLEKANVTRSTGNSLNPILKLDGNGVPSITWREKRYSASDVMYVRFDGCSVWVGANGMEFDPITGLNANVSDNGGNSKSQSISHFGSASRPSIAWSDDTYGESEIFYVGWNGNKRDYSFFVKVDDPVKQSVIENTARFADSYDEYSSNTLHLKISDIPKYGIDVSKRALKSHCYKDDIFTFEVTVENNGRQDLSNVKLVDVFPRELELINTNPPAKIGKNNADFLIGDLLRGQKRRFTLNFRLKKDVYVGEGLLLNNRAIASADNVDSVQAETGFYVLVSGKVDSIQLNTYWSGIDLRNSTCKVGDKISLSMKPTGGSPPYEIVIEWGDGTEKVVLYDVENLDNRILYHTFDQLGEYSVLIRCTDQFARTQIVERKIEVSR